MANEKDGSAPMTGTEEILWPTETKTALMDCAAGRFDIKVAVADEAMDGGQKLQFWLQDKTTKRQFFKKLLAKDFKEVVGDVGIAMPAFVNMVYDVIQAPSCKTDKLQACLALSRDTLAFKMTYTPDKYMNKIMEINVPERATTPLDRVTARLAESEQEIKDLKTLLRGISMCTLPVPQDIPSDEVCKKGSGKGLNVWTLLVTNPYYGANNEGSSGHYQFSGNRYLIQDTDYRQKEQGVSTSHTSIGCIQAQFPAPVYVNTVKIAPFPKGGWGNIANEDSLCIQVFEADSLAWTTLKSGIPSNTQETTYEIKKVIMALRLQGIYVSISKLIFN